MPAMDKIKSFENFVDNLKEFNDVVTTLTDEQLSPPKSKKKKRAKGQELEKQIKYSDLELLVGIYKLLILDFKKYSQRWKFDSLVNLINSEKSKTNENNLVKWFALEILSLLFSLTPSQKDKYFRMYFSSADLEDLNFKFNQIIIGDELSMVEQETLKNKANLMKTNFNKKDNEIYKRQVFLPVKNDKDVNQNTSLMDVDQKNIGLVLVKTTKSNLERLEMSITTDNCIIVEGALSCGKTTLIEHLAEKNKQQLIKYQMDDFMDSKALIDVPGEFMWKPGPLFKAVSEDSWLLLEDFDNSPVDSLSLLIDLLETESIKSSASSSIEIGSNFRIFLTMRKGLKQSSNLHFIDTIKKLGRSIEIHELNELEIKEIICRKYPKFYNSTKNKIIDTVLDVCNSLQMFDNFKSVKSGENNIFTRVRDVRHLSLRDLLKLFERFNAIPEFNDQKMVKLYLQDIYDCFLSSIQNKEVRTELAINTGYSFNINKEEVSNLLLTSKPNFEKRTTEITCGRVTLPLPDLTDINNNTQSSLVNAEAQKKDFFVYTKASLKLLEQVARSIECNEPVLLCGETGVGKTSSLQHLAKLLGKKMNVINLSQQTETGDLLGSYKPVDIKSQMKIVKEKFLVLFVKSFNEHENETFLNHIQKCYTDSNWKFLLKLLLHATSSACKKFIKEKAKKTIITGWREFKAILTKINENFEQMMNKFSFQFFEGVLTKAIVNGEWIILDEINLASPETLQFLTPLLDNNDSNDSHIILYEKGSTEPLVRHPDFRLFGAMNPASDIGKRNLPINIRNRFTEFYVEELDNEEDLSILVREYLHSLSNVSIDLIRSIVHFYLGLKDENVIKQLLNGTGVSPNYSLRTLCRALKNASNNFCNNTTVSIYDGICLSFLTDLNRESSAFLEEHIKTSLFKSNKSKVIAKILRKKPKQQVLDNFSEKLDYVNIEDYWVLKGHNEIPDISIQQTSYIFTKSIQENLKRLVRVCSAQLPCLIQGDTSIGKTSLVKWLAQATGNVLIRINNHDHTDLQEYIGSYVIEPSGKLSFKEGLLAKAMRNGYWILLDELNLASSEVLEALNRVLDDNRELFIPETQEIIKAHPRFVLFATQNPPGKYAGRKQLSRAFRNRFIELHFDELPEDELLLIVEKKCKLPASYAKLLIRTVSELKTKRSQMSGIFLGKHSLITLRDLFRWANRFSKADQTECEDWKQYLAEQGLLILTSRCRSIEDVKTIHSCIQSVFGKKIPLENLTNPETFCKPIMNELNKLMEFSLANSNDAELKNFVWTATAKRTALLAGLAYKFNEPFLLVGETGIGKTTICQILAMINNKYLNIVNCHMHSEAADFLGSIRPVRNTEASDSNQLFEWQDGPLVVALREGQDFLIDEISLADDSVLERLNSVLEEDRTLLVAENASSNSALLVANPRFRIFSTMNPGGDFGKKELSAALRNRFTEIWCPTPTQESTEFEIICNEKLTIAIPGNSELEPIVKNICKITIVAFLRWLSKQPFFSKKSLSSGTISIRDLMRWIKFINMYTRQPSINMDKIALNPILALIHGAHLVFIDALNIETNSLITTNPSHECTQFIFDTVQNFLDSSDMLILKEFKIHEDFQNDLFSIRNEANTFGCGPFVIDKRENGKDFDLTKQYSLNSQSTIENVQRIMRCLLMDNPIMLEGSPGVGKTSIIETLGKLTRNKVIRINLSEQTDLSELFGADLPASETDKENNTQTQKFCWRDGPFLLALKQGNWIILDEINLASQSVLEGLNSCFDHRGEIYVSELNRKFLINKTQTKIFACQNPYLQGGGRKGLPKSFLNRFSKVYVNKMSNTDLLAILKAIYSDGITADCLEKMIQFNEKLNQEVLIERKWGGSGAPWEFNLRDLFRWCDLVVKEEHHSSANPGNYIFLIYAARFRNSNDKSQLMRVFHEVFGYEAYQQDLTTTVRFTKTHLQIGQSFLKYPLCHHLENNSTLTHAANYSFTDLNLKHLESIIKCLEMNWMVILVGSSCVGKTSLVRMVADMMNQDLVEFPVNNATDTSDLLGGFNKIEHETKVFREVAEKLSIVYEKLIKSFLELKDKKKMNQEKIQSFVTEYFQYKTDLKSNESRSDFFESTIVKLNDVLRKDKKLRFLVHELTDISNNLQQIKQRQNEPKKKMNFEWIDSTLVNAIENGQWLLIDNANFCSPSVLDRLNPLLEMNGNLQINEKGIGENGVIPTIQAHKNFRIILCMNESFGELSRPMRNRGVEIYMNEMSPVEFPNDEKIILKSLYSFGDEEFEFFYENVIDMKTDKIRKMNFSQILKVFKLIYDFWLVESQLASYSAATCLEHAVYEFRMGNVKEEPKEDIDMKDEDATQLIKRHHYFSDTLKLKEFSLYRYLFNFPLYSSFIQQIRDYFRTGSIPIDLKNYFDFFIDSIKTTQMIEIWMKNIPIGMASNVLKLVNSSLDNEQLNQKFLKEKIYSLFELVALKTFNFKANDKFQSFYNVLQEFGTVENMDLLEETIDLSSNVFLCKKLKKLDENKLESTLVVSYLLKLEVCFNLSKYRMKKFYEVQVDSLFAIAKDLDSDEQMEHDDNDDDSSVLKSSFKYLGLFEEFYEMFTRDLMAAMFEKLTHGENGCDDQMALIKSTIYLFEKFYLICASKFDPILTVSYLKYYWSFLSTNLIEINKSFSNVTWSSKLDSFIKIFEQNLFYDNSIFEVYRKVWRHHRPQISIHNKEELAACEALNKKLVHLSSIYFQQSSYDTLYEAIQHLNNRNEINKKLSVDYMEISKRLDNGSIQKALSSELDCCANSKLNSLEYEDFLDELNAIYIKNQNLPVYYFADMVRDFHSLFNNDESETSQELSSLKNLTHMVTKEMTFGRFGFLFDQMANKFVNFLIGYQNVLKIGIEMDKVANENSSFSIDSTVESKTKFLITELKNTYNSLINKSTQELNHKSILHYNWVSEYMIELFFKNLDTAKFGDNQEAVKVYNYSTAMIQIKLCHFDHKISQLDSLNSFIWSNYSTLENTKVIVDLEAKLVDHLTHQIACVKEQCFENNEEAFNEYLTKRNFNFKLMNLKHRIVQAIVSEQSELASKLTSLLDIIVQGCMLTHMFSPCDPLDPFEYEILVKKCKDDELEITHNEHKLEEFNDKNKLKDSKFKSDDYEREQSPEDFHFERTNQSDYFFIKNEFENGLKQFCSYERLGLLIEDLFKVYLSTGKTKKTRELLDNEFKVWTTSLEKFSEKIMNSFYSYIDVIYLPLNGLALIGYAVKAIYTNLRIIFAENNQTQKIDLVNYLYTFPYRENHTDIAKKLLTYSNTDKPKLNDELNLLSLQHLFNAIRYQNLNRNDLISNTQGHDALLDIAVYFNKRYKAFNDFKEEESRVETFKYKEYGQKEIQQELEDKELESNFPSYVKYFNDFDDKADGLNDTENTESPNNNEDDEELEEELTSDNEKDKKTLIDFKFLVQAYDLIDKFYEFSNTDLSIQNNITLFENSLLKTFYSSYSIGSTIVQEENLELPNVIDQNNSLLSHIMFTSSINYDCPTFNIVYEKNKKNEKFAYNIYHDSNHAEVIRSKKILSTFKARINELLNGEFENNPVLLELKKIIKRIESFDLNDSIMKFVTGLELLYQKAEGWQIIGGKMYTIEPECRLVNSLIVEWRKMELSFWQKSLELEQDAIKKRNAHVWFNHVLAICIEFLNNVEDEANDKSFFDTLKTFVELSSNGDYFIRLKQLKICYRIFELSDTNNSNRQHLLHSLWNVYNYFDVLYSSIIQGNISDQKGKIEKELKDFIQICRWQDFNYWALKSSTIKFNKGVFKIIRKFRYYLREKIDLNCLVNKKDLNKSIIIHDKFSLVPKDFKTALKAIGCDSFTDSELANEHFNKSYYFKMKKLVKETLIKKCLKTNINEALGDFTEGIFSNFCEIDKAANSFMSEYQNEKNKDTTAKYKKDIKGLINQKSKYISDLMKNLAFIGLSYRRGNLQHASDQDECKKVIVFEPCALTSFNKTKHLGELEDLFAKTDFNYYLCVDRFFVFKEMMNSKQQVVSKDLNNVPIEKFRGFIEHLFQVIYRQKEQLHGFLNQLNYFNILTDTFSLITDASSFELNNFESFKEIKNYCSKAFDMIHQIEMFFKSINEGTSEINISYEAIREKLNTQKSFITSNSFEINSMSTNDSSELLQLNQSCKFTFTNDKTKENLQNLKKSINLASDFSSNLNDLNKTATEKCIPFKTLFEEISNDLVNLNEKVNNLPSVETHDDIDLVDIQESANKATLRILKSVENIFKKNSEKSTEEYPNELFEVKSKFIDESFSNFKMDIKTFDLENINSHLKSCLNSIKYTENLDELKRIFFSVSLFCQLYLKFLTKWSSYLLDNHKESCKCFYALLYIFTELKTKGFQLPDDFDEEEADDNENRNPNRKFELDNQDPSGLADNEEGQKDVSDQIENEDQLDDAKRPGESEDEKEKEEKNPIEDNEKGIEMSEDFEGEMEDAKDEENKEEKKDDKEDDNDIDEMEDLEDQKGDVDDDEQVLDEKLWDENEEDGKNNESEEELDTLDEDDNPKNQHGKEQELASKSDMKSSEEQDENKDTGAEPKVDEENIENGSDEENEDKDNDEAENEKSQKINEQSDVDDEQSNSDETEEARDDNEKTNDKDKNPETDEKEPEPSEDNKTGDDIQMDDQEQDETKESDKEDGETEPSDNVEKDEDMPEEPEKEDEENESNKNADNRETKPISQNELNKDDMDKPNNSKAEENNAMCDETQNQEDEDKKEKEDTDMNSVQDKVSTNNEGKLGNQKSQYLDKSKEDNRKKIGSKNEERVLSDEKDKLTENFNLIEIDDKINDDNTAESKDTQQDSSAPNNDLRHIQNENENYDNQIYDAATDKQKEKKLDENEEAGTEKLDKSDQKANDKSKSEESTENIEMQNDVKLDVKQNIEELKATEKVKKDNKVSDDDKEKLGTGDEVTEADVKKENDEEDRKDSFYAMSKENLLDYSTTREEVETNLKKFRELNICKEESEMTGDITTESIHLWQEYESLTQQMSKELCEQLRLILEPTVCSKLKGDYKSGKRLNMKRVIEYIATEYRKDKIWLRRIKPNKRDYQVMLAIDNSSSMGDNHCIQLAYETIATLMNAFNYLEVGQLGLLKFGEKVSQLHDLQTNFHSDDGAKVLSQIDFKDETTKIAEMLDMSTDIFNASASRSNKISTAVNVSKLLVILSDGRGIFYEGMETVRNSIRAAMQEGIFIVFVLLETPSNKSSIFDIKMPIFNAGSPVPIIKSYMEQFPFPFYVVLKDVNNLPNIIGEALKEWFDMVARLDS